MNPDVVQVAPLPDAPLDSTLRKIAELLGLHVARVSDFAEALGVAERQDSRGSQIAFLVNAAALSPAHQRLNVFVVDALRKQGRWLVYGLPQEGSPPDGWIRYFGCRLPDLCLKRANEGRFRFARGVPFLGEREFRSPGAFGGPVFDNSARSPLKAWISVNGNPVLISTPRGDDDAHDYFLSAPVVDVGAAPAPTESARSHFAGILPAAIAFRALCGDRCWFNPFPTGCVVVDGPTIRPRYGWFNYSQVLSELKAQDYSATVAFIPCNFRRSDRALAGELAAHPDRFSICVHGCHHSKDEFAETAPDSLRAKGRLALRYMEQHTQLTRLPFDRTMVFAKSGFSGAAIEALKDCGYMAAVSTEAKAADPLDAPVPIGDTFELAIQRYANLPLFTRRIPRDPFEFAVDLFFGKPVIIAGHHGIFRNGTKPLSRFVREIKAINDHTASIPISWKPLQAALTSSGKYRVLDAGHFEVQFATSEFRIQNPSRSEAAFECWKPEPCSEEIESVTIDGTPCDYSIRDKRLHLDLSLEAGQARVIQVNRRPRGLDAEAPEPPFIFPAFIRRRLAELRDNCIARFR